MMIQFIWKHLIVYSKRGWHLWVNTVICQATCSSTMLLKSWIFICSAILHHQMAADVRYTYYANIIILIFVVFCGVIVINALENNYTIWGLVQCSFQNVYITIMCSQCMLPSIILKSDRPLLERLSLTHRLEAYARSKVHLVDDQDWHGREINQTKPNPKCCYLSYY